MLNKLLRVGEGRMVKRLDAIASHVETLSDDVEALTDAELRAKTDEFKERIADGASLDELLPEAFAVAREAAWRVLDQKHFHVQIMGGAALHYGNIAEMKTGEGKTLTCVLPAYLNALSGDGVHVVTVNDYLAKRDSEWMGRVHRFLGLDTAVILTGMSSAARREAYAADITYGTNNEFGFDYLRDNMAHSLEDLVQRGHSYAIVDEVDSILVDEARTPLIISGPAEGSSKWYTEFARIAPLLERDVHYEVDIKKKTVGVHEAGVEFVEDRLGIDNLYEAANSPLVSYLNNAIKVKELFQRDKDYIVRNGNVMIVDEFTGRVLDGRRFNEGLHQAIEAKEGVEIKAENQTLATITLQNYFRLYEKLSGMTGTAETEAAEFDQIYKLGVLPIPTNKPMIRKDQGDLIYKTEEAKFAAVVDDVTERHATGQPVLIGTTSVERSEYLSRQLKKREIPHSVLNAKFHEQEAQIIAEAGRLGAVTVATNMAGRGTDVVLGGNPDIIADTRLRKAGLDPVQTPDEYEAAWDEAIEVARTDAAKEAEEVRAAGGLYVLGTERHESRRIDNQLRGRSGRQGDPGESRFYLSVADELMRRFNGGALEAIMNRLPDDVPIEAKMVTKAIRSAQTQVEQQNFEMRKNVLKYDEVMNEQRKVIYAERRTILEGEDHHEQVKQMVDDVVGAYVDGATAEGYAEDWDLDELWTALRALYPIELDPKDVVGESEYGERDDISADELREKLVADARAAYDTREKQIDAIAGEGAMRQLERSVLLSVLDRKWRDHLYEMDYLREGIHLRSMAQRDPVVEYQREGFDMFHGMLEGLKEETLSILFNAQVQTQQPAAEQPLPSAADLRAAVGAGAPAPVPAPAPAADSGAQAPAALRAPTQSADAAVTYSGPGEGGGTVVHSGEEELSGAAESASRRERRAAARATTKGSRPKPPKSKKQRR
ncbi:MULTISPECIES: preprotein translocase subunit SecA [Gordonia]|uniref:preprotein translocase subunit SecA n=1 Tax=Gordonia TaxID=2053 RepID=UPI001963E964|nr:MULTISPECIES: preprotein translocase subunit SecA [unclassified Gordonia (in: high G+C Gram-positive bacteria)]MBN0972979.1 preprotein translocase subunit SecA [Gordonia sp. BP-119]MBN0982022.1 preprotein translocase subunit SecA [Gordonia sp. BP-94]